MEAARESIRLSCELHLLIGEKLLRGEMGPITNSVPELVHSLSSSRELMPTDRMTAVEALTRPA
jgi:hypothetical protein